MENVISRNNSHDQQSRSKVYSSSGKEYKDSDSYIDSSEIDSHLDVIPISGVNTIEYTQENLTKMIPGFTMINCIYSSYPDLITGNNEITLESLVEILKEGARVNWFEWFGDDLILSLAESLVRIIFRFYMKQIF